MTYVTLDQLLDVPVRTPRELLLRIRHRRANKAPTQGYVRNGECWDFTGKSAAPTRRIWERLSGFPVPKTLNICHTCDRGKCGRPKHLWKGTQSENIRDSVAKGRHIMQVRPELVTAYLPRGKTHWTRRHPEWTAKFPRGEHHWTRRQPERIARKPRNVDGRFAVEKKRAS